MSIIKLKQLIILALCLFILQINSNMIRNHLKIRNSIRNHNKLKIKKGILDDNDNFLTIPTNLSEN